MKRYMFLITMLSLIIGTGNTTAQKGISFKVSYNVDSKVRSYANKDIKEFHAFQKDVNDFTKAVHRDNERKARRIKNSILKSMRKEIRDTQEKIRYAKWELDQSYDQGLHQKNRISNEYSKRNSSQNSYGVKDLRALNKQLDIQTKIVFKLEHMHLENGRDFFKQAQNHKRFMQDFEETLKADINFSFKEYRNRNRRN